MGKASLAFGIIILFVGVLICSASNSSKENPGEIPVGIQNGWETSGYFDERNELLVWFTAPKKDMVPDGWQVVVVDIFDPNGGKTRFVVSFKNGVFDHINVSSYDGGLIVSEPPTGVGGLTQCSGNYTACIDPEANPLASLYYPQGPPKLELLKLVVEKEYPYRSFLPVGIVLIVVGISLSIWSRRSLKRKRRRREKKL